jgi:hypothetical protein
MQRTQIEGELPIAIYLVVEQTPMKLKKVVMTQMTAIESIEAVNPGEYISISELAYMTKLVDEQGNHHQMKYIDLGHSSRKNLTYLQELRDKLDAKEIAENSETESDSSES